MSKFHDILLPIADLLDKKNTDYGDSYRHLREEFGPTSFVIRLMDKVNRVKKLTNADALVKSESLQDTIKDIIGYCTLELSYLENCATDTNVGSKEQEKHFCQLRKAECFNNQCKRTPEDHYFNQCWSNMFVHYVGEVEEKVEKSCKTCDRYRKQYGDNCLLLSHDVNDCKAHGFSRWEGN